MRTSGHAVSSISMVLIASFLFVLQPSMARAQKRVSDKDMARMMKNLHYDTKNFRPLFDHAMAKSTIRKTSEAKDAKNLVKTFENQVDAMMITFKKNRTDGTATAMAEGTAAHVDSLLRSVSLGPNVMAQWQKVREELRPIAQGFGVQDTSSYDRADNAARDDSTAYLHSQARREPTGR